MPQIRPPRLQLRRFNLQPQRLAQDTDLILQSTDEAQLLPPLIRPEPIRGPDHVAHLERLRVPVVAIEARLQVFILFRLEEVVVVAALGQVVGLVVGAVVADLFGRGAERVFVFADQLAVLALFAFQEVNDALGG